jgi:putative SOS response-associated peptidase YedK
MCGRFTHNLTWEEIRRLYQLTLITEPNDFLREVHDRMQPVDRPGVALPSEA